MAASLEDPACNKEFLLRKVQEQSSGIARAFCRGKLARLSPSSTWDDPIGSDVSCHGPDHESCLSPAVRALLGRPLLPVTRREGDPFINSGLTLNWEEVGAHFAKVDPELADCSLGAGVVAELAASTTPLLALSTTEYQCRGSFDERVGWTGHSREFVESLDHLTCPAKSHGSPDVLVSLLLSTAYLERALGDVYLHVSRSDRCPAVLKDLLGQKELVEVFGALPMYLVKCMIGPPTSLNLRNLVWHGFVAPTELHPEYAALMLVLVSSLGELLERQGGGAVGGGMLHRPPVDLEEPASLLQVSAGFSPNSRSLKHLLLSSFLVLPSRRVVWSAALDHWIHGQYGVFLLLVLPELETSLRIVFACCNNCPHRTLTAETSTLFTTFVEILSPVVSGGEAAEDGENQLAKELGRPVMEMLLDLLVHTQGLRLRDRISHGEVDLLVCSRELTTFVLFITAVLCQKYSCTVIEGEEVPSDVVCQYQSVFHPVAFLKREVLCVLDVLSHWDDIRVPQEWLAEGRGQECAGRRGQVFSGPPPLEQCVADMMDWAEEGGASPSVDTVQRVWRNMGTLFLPRWQMEVVGLLHQLTTNCHKALEQVRVTAGERYKQSCDKALRSRQRENYQRLLNSLPIIRTAGYFCAAVVLSQAAHLSRSEEATRKAIRVLKRVLSLMENLQSQTSATRNQWGEATQLCHSLLPQLTDKLRHTHTHTHTHTHAESKTSR